jgi:phage tail-like protein
MANPKAETTIYPFISFNFAVEINLPGNNAPLCNAAFAECDGLEMSMDVKTIREGGNNVSQIRMAGPTNYGQLSLKRGMTSSRDLWRWFQQVQQNPRLRADITIVIYAPDRTTINAEFRLSRCLPLKLKAPALNAKDGMIAVEELQLAYERLMLKGES